MPYSEMLALVVSIGWATNLSLLITAWAILSAPHFANVAAYYTMLDEDECAKRSIYSWQRDARRNCIGGVRECWPSVIQLELSSI